MNQPKKDGTLRERAKEVYLKMWGHGPAINGSDVDIIVEALLEARRAAIKECAAEIEGTISQGLMQEYIDDRMDMVQAIRALLKEKT